MKNEQVVPDYKIMLETSVTLLALVASGWLLIKLISACFWLPDFLKRWNLEESNININQLAENEELKEEEKIDTKNKCAEQGSDSNERVDDAQELKQIEEENKKDK